MRATQRWWHVAVSSSALLVGSVFVVTWGLAQSQVALVVLLPAAWQGAWWGGVEMALVAGLLWLLTRAYWPTWSWYDVAQVAIEGVCVATLLLAAGWYFALLDIELQVVWPGLLQAVALLVPLALWCISEEVVLRVRLIQRLATEAPWVRWGTALCVAVALQVFLSSTWSWPTVCVILAGEVLSLISWWREGRFGLVWGRRLAWRWCAVVVIGFPGLGMSVESVRPVVVMPADLEVGALLVAAWLLSWLLALLIQHSLDTDTVPAHATFGK